KSRSPTSRQRASAPRAGPRRGSRPLSARSRRLGGRHPQTERARDDLEARRRRARLLAVELDRQWLLRGHRDRPSPQELEPGVREVVPAVRLRKDEEEIALRDVTDEEHVEYAVVGLRLGA